MTFTLRPHQAADLAFFIKQRKMLDLSEPSTGKTAPACLFMYFLWEYEQTKTVFISGLKTILEKNYDDLLQFSDFKPDEIVIVDHPPKKRTEIFNNPKYKVFLMGPDCFANNFAEFHKAQPQWNSIVVDEVHIPYGNPTTKRSEALLRSAKVKNFLAMSGTIIDGKLTSAYVPIKMINPLIYPSFESFKGIHCIEDDWGNVQMYINHDILRQKLARVSVRHTVQEVYGDSSKTIIQKRLVNMSAGMKSAYKEMEAEASLELEDSFLTAANEGVGLCRCRQLLSCPEIFDLKYAVPKDEVMLEHFMNCKETGEQLLVFAQYKAEHERLVKLAESLGLKTAKINSDVTNKRRAEISKQFVLKEIQILVASPATCSVGFNWEMCNKIVFTDLGYKDSDFLQAIKRCNRGTRKTPLIVEVLEYKSTIEEKIWWILSHKSKEARRITPNSQIIREGEIG